MPTSLIRQFIMRDEKRFSSIIAWTLLARESQISQRSGTTQICTNLYKLARRFIHVICLRLTPLPTCHSFTDCGSCLENEIKFKCNWCPSLNRCSSGVDRKRQEWTNAGEFIKHWSKWANLKWDIFRVRQDANIRRCQVMRCNDPQHIINSPRGLDPRKW